MTPEEEWPGWEDVTMLRKTLNSEVTGLQSRVSGKVDGHVCVHLVCKKV